VKRQWWVEKAHAVFTAPPPPPPFYACVSVFVQHVLYTYSKQPTSIHKKKNNQLVEEEAWPTRQRHRHNVGVFFRYYTRKETRKKNR
jgi:hypothetical protein